MLATRVCPQRLLGSGRAPNCFATNHFIDREKKLIGAAQLPVYRRMKCEGFD